MLGSAGFDAKRDIAGIVLNRWGHAYIAPQPGFYFGTPGKPAPLAVVRERYGRIAFGHSELSGRQSWGRAAHETRRAFREVLESCEDRPGARRTTHDPHRPFYARTGCRPGA